MRLAIGIDTGGTFTDVMAFDLDRPDQLPLTLKIPSTPEDPSDAIAAALGTLREPTSGTTADVGYLAHGTTVATNSLIEGRLAATGMVTTRGFRDIIELARNRRPHLYDLNVGKPHPIALRHMRFEVDERVTFDGQVYLPLDEHGLHDIAQRLRASDVKAVAICFLHSFRNPQHELRARELLTAELSDLPMCTSFDVMPEWREYERFATTLVNAALMPIVGRYLGRLGERCADLNIGISPLIMQSSGGLAAVERATQLPVMTLYSGPSAGVIGAVKIADQAGLRDIITLDVGGTSTDVCLVTDGHPTFVHQRDVAGHTLKLPSIAVHSVGAGGGSIVWVDAGGFMQVGPQSAGARPGPACYGFGGTLPTITDAHLALGTLGEEQLLGGRVRLAVAEARKAFTPIANRLGQSIEAAASGALAIMTANIARAIRLVSIDRGHDPRHFNLVAFGGAGPMHAAQVAAELEMDTVLVPPSPGLLCATGLLYAPVRADFVRTYPHDLANSDTSGLLRTFMVLEREAHTTLRQQGAPDSGADIRWLVGMNFAGQEHELTVELPRKSFDPDAIQMLDRLFRDEYLQRYAYSPPNGRTRIMNCRVSTQWSAQTSISPTMPVAAFSQRSESREREVYFEPGHARRTRVYDRSTLAPGRKIEGPMIILQLDSTTVIPPGWRVHIDPGGNLILERR